MDPRQNHKQQGRRLRRFYIPRPLSQAQGIIFIEPGETRHLRDIIRLGVGDRCLVTDGQGWEAEAEICEFLRDGRTRLAILGIKRKVEARPNKIFLRMMPALLQKGKNDLLVEKAQELGADEFFPIFSDRCEVKIPGDRISKTADRWRRIAVEASKQSGVLKTVKITEPKMFARAVESLGPEDALVIFHPGPDSPAFMKWAEAFRVRTNDFKSLNVLIGPEGGFTDEEIGRALSCRAGENTWVVGLGDTVLKADTAFVGVLSALRFLEII